MLGQKIPTLFEPKMIQFELGRKRDRLRRVATNYKLKLHFMGQKFNLINALK